MTRAFSQPSFSRSQSWASQARSDTTVEDSEPERQERRLKAKTTRRVKSKKTPVGGAARRSEDVIELTDSSPSRPSTPAPRLLNAQPAPFVIIDVSDDNDSSTRHDPLGTRPFEDDSDHVAVDGLGIEISGDGTLEDESLPSIRRVLGLPKAREQKVVQVPGSVFSVPSGPALLPISTCTSPESSEDESGSAGSKLKLGHFAYTAPNPLRRTASKTPSPVERDSQTPDVISNAAKPSPTHRFAQDFTAAQLSRLLKCVSCELAWTARKTVKEKMKHIQSCAKKNRLTDETVRILLRTELAKLPPVASSSKSKSSPEPLAPSVAETLLEETLKDKRRKRSGPRLQAQPTVKEVSETRNDILDKARLLLQNVRNVAPADCSASRQIAEASTGSTNRDSTMPPPTQAFAKSSVAVRANDHPAMGAADTTQAFGSSRFGVVRIQERIINAGAAIAGESDVSPLTQVFTKSALASAVADVDPADGMPPATQVFAPSKLTNGGPFTREVAPANDDPMDQPISLYDSSEDDLDPSKSSPARRSVIEIPSSPSSNAKHPRPLKSPTERIPRAAAAADSAAQGLRSPSPPAQSPSPAGNEPGSPEYYDGPDFHVQNEYEYLWNEWDREQNMWDEYDGGGDAVLHYDPDAGAGPLAGSGSRTPPKSPSPTSPLSPPRRRLAAIPEDGAPVAGPSRLRDGPEPPVEAVAKKKRGRPRRVATDESDAEPSAVSGKDISQEELNTKLKEAVLKDEVLHLRILRYEPIHFDVFMQLAADAGVTEKKTKLKGKVRTFLDQKAIHFYGADPAKSRTKRTRHP